MNRLPDRGETGEPGESNHPDGTPGITNDRGSVSAADPSGVSPSPAHPRDAAQETLAAAKMLAAQIGALIRTLAASGARRIRVGSSQTLSRISPWRDGIAGATGRLEPLLRAVAGRFRGVRPGLSLGRFPWRLALAISGTGLLLLLGFLAYNVATLPINGGLQAEATQSALTFESDRGEAFAARGVLKGDKLAAADLPPYLAQAIVAIEDRRFHQHSGVDFRGLARAAWRNSQAGGAREGGSTITQQLARLMFLSQEKTLRRKVQEAMLAMWLESQLSKEEILVRYLNTAFFGAGAYGVDAAAKRYFGKRSKELSLGEAAMLAGLVRAPSQLAPTRNFGGAKERADIVLQAMVETGAITAKEADAARAEPVALRTPPETPPGANYFVDMVAGDMRRLLGSSSGDLTLRTTLNLELQRLAEGVIERRLDAEGSKKNVSQAALVAMSPDGAILALVGGRDYEASQFNRAVQGKRQAGSLFKLFVYLTAFQKGYNPQSVLVDRPTQIGDWEPQNYSGRYRGAVSLRTAFAQSLNTIAAQLADEVGIPAVIETARRMGVQSNLPAVPSLALGSAEVTLMEMTRAFAAVAAGVQSVEPYAVRAIASNAQQALYTRPAGGPEVSGQLGETRAMMVDLLQAVVNEGTGKGARLPNVAVAGKTGTTQEYRDAWFVGFTSDLVVGVWVGNDDNEPMDQVAGGGLPAIIWQDFASRAAPAVAKKQPAVVQASSRSSNPASAQAPRTPESGIRGVPDVVDTGTLEIRGKIVRLQGIQGEPGRMASQLARYLRRREVACEPTGAPDVQRCRMGDDDLAELIVGAGGARAAPDAPPELLAAEEQARSARLGMWRRER